MEDEWWIDYSHYPGPPSRLGLGWDQDDADPAADLRAMMDQMASYVADRASITLTTVSATVNGVLITGVGRTLEEAMKDCSTKIAGSLEDLKNALTTTFGGQILRLQPIVDEIEEFTNPKPKRPRDKGRPNNNTGPRPERQFGRGGRKRY